jgi:hypothetical protein
MLPALFKGFPDAHSHPSSSPPSLLPQGFQKLQLLLRAILLRRTKGTTIKGTPIINLPERRQELVKVPLTRAEADFYKQVCVHGGGGGRRRRTLGWRDGGGVCFSSCQQWQRQEKEFAAYCTHVTYLGSTNTPPPTPCRLRLLLLLPWRRPNQRRQQEGAGST